MHGGVSDRPTVMQASEMAGVCRVGTNAPRLPRVVGSVSLLGLALYIMPRTLALPLDQDDYSNTIRSDSVCGARPLNHDGQQDGSRSLGWADAGAALDVEVVWTS